jgi:4-amino-4-deoxychorismate lyase
MTVSEHTITLVNGEVSSSIDVTDRGLQFGDGVFETIRIDRGRLVWWQQHMSRLLEGCRRLHFSNLPDVEVLLKEAVQLSENCTQGALKIIITRGYSNCGYSIPREISPNRILLMRPGMSNSAQAKQGICLGVCRQRISSTTNLSGIKHLNRLEQVLARMECASEGWDEGLMLNERGKVMEGSMSNLFVWQHDHLFTPLLENAGVEGIARGIIIKLAQKCGIAVEQGELDILDLPNVDELFVCNSLIGLWPVSQIKIPQSGLQNFEIGDKTRFLQQQLEEAMCFAD